MRRMFAPAVSVATLVVTSVVTSVVVASGSPVAASFSCSSGAPTYTVRSGDGWFGIADRVGVERAELLGANGATPEDRLMPGDRLCLPAGADLAAACGNAYTVAAGDSWFGVASRAGTTGAALLAANGASTQQALHPGDRICLPDGVAAPSGSGSSASGGGAGGSDRTYTVARGDSWFAIATRAEVAMSTLLDVNDAEADTVLVPGEKIALPSGARNPARAAGSATVSVEALPTQGPCWYADTWMSPRSDGRRHEGVDLFTKHGEYVYAVVDGVLTDRAWDQPDRRAGNAWTLTSADGSGTWFFYAHLADFAPNLKVGSRVRAGQIIGFVGQTGNAAAVHLHFEVHPNGGDAVNPYPIVRARGGCNRDTPYAQPGGWVPEVLD
jgi:LysM repeat protein